MNNIDPNEVEWEKPFTPIETKQPEIDPNEVEWEKPFEAMATPESVDAEPQGQPETAEESRTLGEEAKRQLGLTARALVEGGAGTLGVPVDPISVLMNQFIPEGKKIPTMYTWARDTLTQAGVPEPEGKAEEIVQQISQLMAGAAIPAGAAKIGAKIASTGAPRKIGQKILDVITGRTPQASFGAAQQAPKTKRTLEMIASSPEQQIVAAGVGEASRIGAEELGAPLPVQLGASLAGGMAGGRFAGKRLGERTAEELIEESLTPGDRRLRPVIEETTKEFKVPAFTSDVVPPRTRMGKAWQTLIETIPITGMGRARRGQQQARIAAIKEVLDDYGVRYSDNISDEVMLDLLETNQQKFKRASDLKWDVISSLSDSGKVPVNNTIDAAQREIRRLKQISKSGELNPLITRLENFISDVRGQSLEYLEENRKQLGKFFSSPSQTEVKDIGEKAANKIYAALNRDMGSFIEKKGGKAAYNKWRVGNKRIHNLKSEMDKTLLKSVLNKGVNTPEEINRILFSKKPSELKLLKSRLSKDGRNNAKIAILKRVMDDANGYENLSPAKFASQMKKKGDSIGIFFSGPELRRIEGLSRALALTKRADVAGLQTHTGMTALPYAIGSFFTELMGSVVGAAGLTLTTGAIGNALESKPVRDFLAEFPSVKAGSIEEAELFKRFMSSLVAKYPDMPDIGEE